MFDFVKIKRNPSGDLTLPFLGFVLVGALTIATLTGLSQYNIMSEKLNTALQEGKTAATSHIQNNLNDSALIGNPSTETLAVLSQARTTGINTAKISLGQKIQEELLKRNPSGGSDLNIFDSAETFVRIANDGSGTAEIQFSVDAQLLSNVPINYKRSTELVKAKPSSFNSQCLELSCSTNCGECGACDTCTGKCIPKFDVADGQGGFKIPDIENSSPDDIVCKLAAPQDICEAEGWNNITEDGIDGCELDGCKFIPNHTAWNINGSFAKVHYEDSEINVPLSATASELSHSGQLYKRDQEFPSDNQDDPGNKNYAVCKEFDGLRVFVTKDKYTGDLVSAANSMGASPPFNLSLFDPNTEGIQIQNAVIAATDFICTSQASNGGLEGNWRALLWYNAGGGASAISPKSFVPFNEGVYLVDNLTKVNLDGPFGFWREHAQSIYKDQNGDNIPSGIDWFVWTGGYNINGNFGIGIPGSHFSSPRGRRTVNNSNCNNWTSASGDTSIMGYTGVTMTPPSLLDLPGFGVLLWAATLGGYDCDQQEGHLYCIERKT